MSSAISCTAPAKINLALHVTGERQDGYHSLESLVVFCRPADELELQWGKGGEKPALKTTGPFAAALGGNDNLILKAAALLRRRFPEAFAAAGGLCFALEKNLPVASGIGGGSADAAATLLVLRHALGIPVSDSALMTLGAEIGSDVPMCLSSSSLIARGRGTDLEPAANLPALDLVLVNPAIAVSTPQIFRILKNKQNPPLAALPGQLSQFMLTSWLKEQRNDLQAPAMAAEPVIGNVLRALETSGASLSRMSGSGATCFGIFAHAEAARKAAGTIAAANPGWWVTATQSADFGMDRVFPV
ncbi:4-(cytidine 5'-diphospho)-2-C-methyl-D-erythritol kinase [Salaquimonas pukyongi]|uniref:4-(cytidine 5'-diphospho)-2-C-methyl-D-erythritol kinase n=1 Tax=Salaquimonas pukyongi TaxID=2712698 RepID=UPI00096B8EB5|nr:4-(cytidine 5'-diphospho)-2-C-methyl-D-erythritol kinase [Salaquimonas pukyongi]